MKKAFVFMLVLALALSIALSASAVELKKVYTFPADTYLEIIHGSDYLFLRDENGAYNVVDACGNVLLEEKLSDRSSAQKGWIGYVEVRNPELTAVGLLSPDARLVIPTEYWIVEIVEPSTYDACYAEGGPFWAIAIRLEEVAEDAEDRDYVSWYGNHHYAISSVDVYTLPEGKLVSTLTRADYKEATAIGRVLCITNRNREIALFDSNFQPVTEEDFLLNGGNYYEACLISDEESGLMGLEAGDHTVLVEPIYKSITRNSDGYPFFEIESENGDGILSPDGQVLLPAEYDRVYTYTNPINGKYILVVGNDADGNEYFGYYEIGVGMVVEADTYKYETTDATSHTLLVKQDDKTLLVTCDGTVTDVTGRYTHVESIDATDGRLFEVRIEDAQGGTSYSIIDSLGNEIVPPSNAVPQITGAGNYLLLQTEEGIDVMVIHYKD